MNKVTEADLPAFFVEMVREIFRGCSGGHISVVDPPSPPYPPAPWEGEIDVDGVRVSVGSMKGPECGDNHRDTT